MNNTRLGEWQVKQSNARYCNDLENEILDKRAAIAQHRATGRTNRIVNEVIESFFSNPMGTKIMVRDHYIGENVGGVDGKLVVDTSHHDVGSPEMKRSIRMADLSLLKKIRHRLTTEYAGVTFDCNYTSYPYTITRTSPTIKEKYESEIEMLKKKLIEIKGTMTEFNVVLPIGISGSGKSTWVKTYEMRGYTVICPDDIRRELTGNISDQSQNNKVFSVAYSRLEECLRLGRGVIFDATNVNTKSRHQLLKFIRDIKSDAKIAYKLFDADVDVSYERIRKDLDNKVDRSNVPREILEHQYENYQNTLKYIGEEELINIDNVL